LLRPVENGNINKMSSYCWLLRKAIVLHCLE